MLAKAVRIPPFCCGTWRSALGVHSKAAPLTTKDLDALWSRPGRRRSQSRPSHLDTGTRTAAQLSACQNAFGRSLRLRLNRSTSLFLNWTVRASRRVVQPSRRWKRWAGGRQSGVAESPAGNPPLEVRQRVGQILEKRDQELRQILPAIEALELMGTTEAEQVLQGFTSRSPIPALPKQPVPLFGDLPKRA